MPKDLKVDVKKRSGEDALMGAAAAYNSLTKTLEVYSSTPLTPFWRKVVFTHELRHWEQDDYGRRRPSPPSMDEEIDAQRAVLTKLRRVPEPMRAALLAQAFLLAFPEISSSHREVLERLARGEHIDRVIEEYRRRLREELSKMGLKPEGADTLADRLKRDLVAYYEYIYAPLSSKPKSEAMGEMAKLLLRYVDALEKAENLAARVEVKSLEDPLSGEELLKIVQREAAGILRELSKKRVPLLPAVRAITNRLYPTIRSVVGDARLADKIAHELTMRLVGYALRLRESR